MHNLIGAVLSIVLASGLMTKAHERNGEIEGCLRDDFAGFENVKPSKTLEELNELLHSEDRNEPDVTETLAKYMPKLSDGEKSRLRSEARDYLHDVSSLIVDNPCFDEAKFQDWMQRQAASAKLRKANQIGEMSLWMVGAELDSDYEDDDDDDGNEDDYDF